MTPRQIYTSAMRAVEKNRSMLIVGGPGIGKTALAKKVSKSLNMKLVVTTPAVAEPIDQKGLGFPSEDKTHATFLPFGQMHQLINATEPTLWFIDDIGQGTNTVQSSLMPWLLERRCGEHSLSEHVRILSATNGRQHKANVNGLLEPVKSRFHKIVTMEPCYKEWREDFAKPNKVPEIIISYLDFQGHKGNSMFNNFVPTSDMTNSPIPRTWANAGDLINDYFASEENEDELDDPGSVLFYDVAGAIGLEAAGDLWSFRKLQSELKDSIDDILDKPNTSHIPNDIRAQFLVINAIARRANEENLENIYKYALRLNQAIPKELVVSMLNDIFSMHPNLSETNTFSKIMCSKQFGYVFAGEK